MQLDELCAEIAKSETNVFRDLSHFSTRDAAKFASEYRVGLEEILTDLKEAEKTIAIIGCRTPEEGHYLYINAAFLARVLEIYLAKVVLPAEKVVQAAVTEGPEASPNA